MKKNKIMTGLLAAVLLLSISACGTQDSAAASTEAAQAETTAEEPSIAAPAHEAGQTRGISPAGPEKNQMAVLYIGSGSNFKEYPFPYEGKDSSDLTPELLIRGISDLTGWDLSLADAVTTGKGGMTVSFAKTSSLFAGPPDPQKEEFFVFDAEDLAHTILDSVQKTLQRNFTGEGGNPDALDIYYCTENDEPLVLDNIGRSWTLDQPYKW